ncbi:MAG: CDP-alcohol phosphatidyltransferase family protein, partial [Sphingomicrobium sp.]
MPAEAPPLMFVPVGSNQARLFGMDARTRACRLAGNAGFECADTVDQGRAVLIASLDYAWDPAWLKAIAARPSSVLTLAGKPVLAHVPVDGPAPAPVAEAFARGDLAALERLEQIPAETFELSYAELRKRERPFVMLLDPADPQAVERAAYDASYKGVTDALTLYLWRKPAFHLTRWAAEAGLSPNMVTAVGAILCGLAFWLFWGGHYWLGSLAGFIFMVLDTVDGKLARCTGTSSKWGNVFDHGIDLIHPPFWWWAWIHGLVAYGRPLEPIYATM